MPVTACVEAHTVRLAVLVPLGDQAVRFQALVADGRHAVAALDVTAASAMSSKPSSTSSPPCRRRGRCCALPADRRHRLRIVLERVLFLDQMRQHLVLDLDGADGVVGVFLGVGGEAEDLVAGVEQLVAGLGDDDARP